MKLTLGQVAQKIIDNLPRHGHLGYMKIISTPVSDSGKREAMLQFEWHSETLHACSNESGRVTIFEKVDGEYVMGTSLGSALESCFNK